MEKKVLSVYLPMGLLAILIVVGGVLLFGMHQEEKGGGYKTYSQLNKQTANKQDDYNEWKKEGMEITATVENIAAIMFSMCSQKVAATDKPNPTLMNQGHIKQVLSYIEKSGHPDKEGLMSIALRWEKADFSKVVDDFNALAGMVSSPAKATGAFDYVDEQTYILNEFGDDAAREFHKEHGEKRERH